MAKTTNKVFFSGRIARPEFKYTASGMAIFTCSLAINDSYLKKGNTEWTEKTIWMYVKSFDKRAEAFQGLQKGVEVLIEGRLKQDDDYTNKEGQKRNGSHYIDPEKITPIENIKKESKPKETKDAETICRQTGIDNIEAGIIISRDAHENKIIDDDGEYVLIDTSTGEELQKVPF